MGRIAFLFPGQASQAVGMHTHLKEYPEAAEFLERTYEFSGLYDLTQTMAEGPTEKLTRTNYAQPAITMVSIAALRILQVAGSIPRHRRSQSGGVFSPGRLGNTHAGNSCKAHQDPRRTDAEMRRYVSRRYAGGPGA